MPDKRIAWIDAAKGFAIILVVLGHVLGGMMARDWLDPHGFFSEVYHYIYLFHMPLFFLISGVFCLPLMRRDPVRAAISRTESIAWPYVFWELFVRTAILPFAGAFMSSPPAEVDWYIRFHQTLTGELS